MPSLYCPPPLPDETLYSLTCRIALWNGLAPNRDTCKAMFGPSESRSATAYPVNLEHFSMVTNGYYGDAKAIAKRLTSQRYFSVLHWANSDGSSSTTRSITTGLREPSAITLGPIGSHRWRYCDACAQEDRATHQISYWHRSHQLPSSFVCEIHATPLLEVALAKGSRDRRLYLPRELKFVSQLRYVAPPSFTDDTLHRMALTGHSILGAGSSIIAGANLFNAAINALQERGLATRSGRIRRDQFKSEFARRYLIGTTPSRGWDVDTATGRLLQAISCDVGHDCWLERMVLVDWLFGSWEALSAWVGWLATMDCDHPIPTAGVNHGDMAVPLEFYRQACIDFLDTNPVASRADLSQHSYKTYRWLLDHDPDWLSTVLPISRHTGQKVLFV